MEIFLAIILISFAVSLLFDTGFLTNLFVFTILASLLGFCSSEKRITLEFPVKPDISEYVEQKSPVIIEKIDKFLNENILKPKEEVKSKTQPETMNGPAY